MKKNVAIVVMIGYLLGTGCVSTRALVNYQEKDDSRKSAVKQLSVTEKSKRPNPSNIFPIWKYSSKLAKRENNKDISMVIVYPVLFLPDLVATIFISPFTKTESSKHGKVIIEGQLVDGDNTPIKIYEFNIEGDRVVSNKNGFFSKQIDTQGSYIQNITITFLKPEDFNRLSKDFNEGNRVNIVTPYKIKYSINDNGRIEVEESIIEVKQEEKQSSNIDTLKINKYSSDLRSDRIILTKAEISSERNKELFIETQKAEEERKTREAIRDEQYRIMQEKEDKRINIIIDKLKNNKSISTYSVDDVETALNKIGMKKEGYAYEALFIYPQQGAFIECVMTILQVIQGQGFLVYLSNTNYIAYVEFNNTKGFYDGQYMRFKGRIAGTHSYVTANYTQRTVPKVLAYIVSGISY